MKTMIGRCSDVVDGEIDLLDEWSQSPHLSNAQRTRCLTRRERIIGGPRTTMNDIVDDANAVPAGAVHSSPTSVHGAMIGANERSLRARGAWNLAHLTDKAFTRGLQRAEANAKDSVRDARVVYRDCTDE